MDKFAKQYPRIHKGIKYAGNALQVAKQAYNMAQTIAGIVNSEKKYTDKTIAINTDTTAAIQCLTNQAQGDTNITRNGNTIALKSLHIEGAIAFDATQKTEMIRIMVIRDNDNLGGTAPTATDILEGATTIALRNKNTPKRFTVLFDKLYCCNDSQLCKRFSYYKKFKMLKDRKGNPTVSQKCYYDGTADTDYTRGHIFLLQLGTVATASTVSSFNAFSRIRFYDN